MSEALVEFARQSIRQGSKSFSLASRLFDPATRAGAWCLYAWCRHCDDVVDHQVLGFADTRPAEATAAQRLDQLRHQTLSALDGQPVENPVFAAFQQVVQRHRIAQRYPLDLLEGFAMDVAGRQYQRLDDTLEYSYHVAGVVGVMMSCVAGARERPTLERACDLGIAFQLTNIARDVMADASMGRCYLPAEWLAEAGVTRDQLTDPDKHHAVFSVVLRLLDSAEPYYASAAVGETELPLRAAWAVATARLVYRDIGRRLRAAGPEGLQQRAVVSKPRALWLLFKAGALTLLRHAPQAPRDHLWTMP